MPVTIHKGRKEKTVKGKNVPRTRTRSKRIDGGGDRDLDRGNDKSE